MKTTLETSEDQPVRRVGVAGISCKGCVSRKTTLETSEEDVTIPVVNNNKSLSKEEEDLFDYLTKGENYTRRE